MFEAVGPDGERRSGGSGHGRQGRSTGRLRSRRSTSLPSPPLWDQVRLLRTIFRDPIPVLDEIAERFEGTCAFGFGPVRLAVVGDPAALRSLFAEPSTSFRWGHKFNVLGFVVGDDSMIVSDGPDHLRRRRSVQSAFSRRRLNRWIPLIVEQADAAIDRLVGSELDAASSVGGGAHFCRVDLYPMGRSMVLNVVVRAFFGERLAPRAEEIGVLFERAQSYLEGSAFKQLPHPFPRTARARVRADRAVLDAMIDGEIADRRLHPSGDSLDLLEALVEDATLTDAEIRDQVVTLIGAGHDTTAASLAWILWRAATEPGLWDRLRAEADAVFGPLAGDQGSGTGGAVVTQSDHSAGFDHRTLHDLGLANRVMHETLRLHPAGVLSPREAAVDVALGDRVIPKGTLVLWSAHIAGRDSAAWPDPMRFDADRFLNLGDDQKAMANEAWVPFGRGARNCIGFALAQMELTLMIARIAQRLDVEAIAATLPEPVGMVVNRPSGGVPMRIRVRNPDGPKPIG